MNLISWAQGKKTYAVVAAGVILGTINGLHDAGLAQSLTIPWYVFAGLGFLGLGTLRAGVSKAVEAAVFAGASGAQTVLAAISTPPGTFTTVSSPTALGLAKQATQSPGYSAATEQQKTDILNESQLHQ